MGRDAYKSHRNEHTLESKRIWSLFHSSSGSSSAIREFQLSELLRLAEPGRKKVETTGEPMEGVLGVSEAREERRHGTRE
jgi:hypothetical protein